MLRENKMITSIKKIPLNIHRWYSFRNLSVCIVGAGPAGFYCAQNFLKVHPSSRIDIYEKLPVPFGLVRFGVAPDHGDVKNVINTFSKVATSSRVNYFGNVNIGEDVLLDDLKNSYDVVVLSYGADKDVELNVEGENLRNIFPARKFVGWYNGLPSEANLDINLSVEDVSIIGQGNVAIDIARILLKPVDDLKSTDITAFALEKLSNSQVKRVNIIGRRGPYQVAFTIKEFREMTKLSNTNVIIDENLFGKNASSIISELPRPRKRLTELLYNIAKSNPSKENNKLLNLLFMRSPLKFTDVNGHVKNIDLCLNRFGSCNSSIENSQVEATELRETLHSELVFKSIGYKSSQLEPCIPLSSSGCISPNVSKGVYSAGWVSTGPSGVLLTTMSNAFATVNLIKNDVDKKIVDIDENKPRFSYIANILHKKGVVIVDWNGWEKINNIELERGKQLGKCREKIVNINEMLKIGGKLI